jgi:hypothetical protein
MEVIRSQRIGLGLCRDHPQNAELVLDLAVQSAPELQLQRHLDKQDERVGAARLLNWFYTPAHSELFIDGLRRATAGRIGQSPEWAKRLVEQWNRCGIEEGKALCIASPNHFSGNESPSC